MLSDPLLLRAYALIIGSALFPIILGSFASIKVPKEPHDKHKPEENEDEDDFDDSDIGHLSSTDALWIPIVASVTLISLFLAFRYLDKDTINRLLSGYFHFAGFFMFARMGLQILKLFIGRSGWRDLTRLEISISKNKQTVIGSSFTYFHIAFVSLSFIFTAAHAYSNHYLLANLFGTVFCFNALTLVKLDSFRTGMILLSGLFLYDCWFVFGTSVMVTVATSFEAPIKMVWPKDSASKPSFTMLGLGDIVLPGLFIALSLRYDYSRFTRSVAVTATGDQKECNSAPHRAMASLSTKYAKPYFWSVFSAYIAGLVTTIFVMHHFQAAQPALLYLSPACIFSVVFCSILRGDKDVWKFKDMNEEGPGESKSQSETSTPKQDRDKERKPSQNSDADNTNSFLLQTPESS